MASKELTSDHKQGDPKQRKNTTETYVFDQTQQMSPGAVERARLDPHRMRAHNILQLQRMVGNRTVNRLIQRNIQAGADWQGGRVDINFVPKARVLGGQQAYGEEGQITFQPGDNLPDAGTIDFTQVIQITDPNGAALPEGDPMRKELAKTWAGMGPGVEAGVVVDVFHQNTAPRTRSTDQDVVPTYGTQVPGHPVQEGMKIGHIRHNAVLDDFPAASQPFRFSAETRVTARPTTGPQHLGTIDWGFETTRNGPNWGVRNERANLQEGPQTASNTFGAAVALFNAEMRRPNTVTSPEYIEQWLGGLRQAHQSRANTQEPQEKLNSTIRNLRLIANRPNPFVVPQQQQAFETLKREYGDLANQVEQQMVQILTAPVGDVIIGEKPDRPPDDEKKDDGRAARLARWAAIKQQRQQVTGDPTSSDTGVV